MNLTTPEGRQAAINALNKSVIEELRNVGVELEEEAVAELREKSVTIGIYKKKDSIILSSDVKIYLGHNKDAGIKVPAAWSFNPTSDPAQYWRTIHAASLLKNWDAVVEVVSAHCLKYGELMLCIQKLNHHE